LFWFFNHISFLASNFWSFFASLCFLGCTDWQYLQVLVATPIAALQLTQVVIVEPLGILKLEYKNNQHLMTTKVTKALHYLSVTLQMFVIWPNWLYAQLHYFLNLSQLLVSCLPLLDKLIDSGVPGLNIHDNNNQTHLN